MSIRSRCTLADQPFFRLVLSFRSRMIFNRYCHRLEILHSIRSQFSLFDQIHPIILYEVRTDREIHLDDTINSDELINPGIYLAFVKYSARKYQPLMDWRLIPMEIFPEKKFLPNNEPFVIDRIQPFVRTLKNTINYMEEYERSQGFSRKEDQSSPSRTISELSTIKRTYRTKSTITQVSSPPISILSTSQDIDIRKYFINDSQRINSKIPPFVVRLLGQHESTFSLPRMIKSIPRFSSSLINPLFNENHLILFKQHFSGTFPRDLKNCIHQLAIEKRIDHREIQNILMQLDDLVMEDRLDLREIPSIITQLKKIATIIRNDSVVDFHLSNLLNICLRIDQLERMNKLEREHVRIFNERIHHLARIGVLHQQNKLFKKLEQLDLFESEPSRELFAQFIHDDLQRLIPKPIPMNSLGFKEIIHQLQINIDRLGLIPALLLIDNLQQINQAGLIITLNRYPQLKRYLTQFIEHLQAGRCIGVHLERLMEQMNNCIGIDSIKKGLFTNQINSLLQKTKITSKNDDIKTKNNLSILISNLLNLAHQGQLNTYVDRISEDPLLSRDDQVEEENLQSLILFLQEQSSSDILPSRTVSEFLQYLRHFAQLGLLNEPIVRHLLLILHQFKDQNTITLEIFEQIFNPMKSINYLSIYPSIDLLELDQFLDEMILHEELTPGQSWYILDRLIDLIRIQSIGNYEIKLLLTNLQLEYHRTQSIYPKLLQSFENLLESSSKSLMELHSLENDLQKLIFSTNIKRIPEDIRKRLNEILNICKTFRHDRIFVEELFGETMNYRFYSTMKEILRTKNLINRKQSLTAIVQIHKHFTRLNTHHHLITDRQLDLILQNIQNKYPKEQKILEESIKNMVKLGCLQEKSFVEYLNEHFLSKEFSLSHCRRIQSWVMTIDLNHGSIRSIVKHLTQLEKHDGIDLGTSIEIQNYLNRLARFQRNPALQLQVLRDRIVQIPGKKSPLDRMPFQSIRLILIDLVYAMELEIFIEKLANEHRIPRHFHHRFLHRIFQNEFSLDQFTQYHHQLKQIYHIRHLDIEAVKRFVLLLSKDVYPLTLTDQLLDRLKWDGKAMDDSIRDQLLKFERSNVLSYDTFEEIYNKLSRTQDLSLVSVDDHPARELFDDLLEKINDLLAENVLDLNHSIELKEQLYLLEEMLNDVNLSTIITIESRLFNAATFEEFQQIAQQLKTYLHQEQFRISKAQDLISKWHLNHSLIDKQILKLFEDLANLYRLSTDSNRSVLNRYLDAKQFLSRSLIKDLQRLKLQAMIDRQAMDDIRSIEFRLFKHRLDESLIKNLHKRLSDLFSSLSRPFDPSFRHEISSKLTDLLENSLRSNHDDPSFEQFFISFDSQIASMKQTRIRTSKHRSHQDSSDALQLIISPSLQSLRSI